MQPAAPARPHPASPPRAWQGWRWLHRWIGLVAGAVLLLCAATGLWLTLAGPQETRRLSALCGPAHASVPLQRLADAVAADKGPLQSLTLRLPDGERACVRAFVRTSAWQGELFLDPATGTVVARREQGQDLHGLIFELHSNLLLGDTGKAVLALAGAAVVVLLVSGTLLWWPLRWRQALRVRLHAGPRVALAGGHRAAGVLLGVAVLASATSGAYVAWRPLAGWVNALAGTPRQPPPALPVAAAPAQAVAEAGSAVPGPASQALAPLDALARAAAWPEAAQARLVDVGVAVGRPGPVRLRYRLAGDPHPNGQSYVWVDPRHAQVLRRQRWDRSDLGARLQGWFYAYHSGRLWGLPHTALLVFAGAALAWFVVSGPLLWALRRRTRA